MKHLWIPNEQLEEHYDGVNFLEIKPDADKIANFTHAVVFSENDRPYLQMAQVKAAYNAEGLLKVLKEKIPEGKGIGAEDLLTLCAIVFDKAVLKTCEFYEGNKDEATH